MLKDGFSLIGTKFKANIKKLKLHDSDDLKTVYTIKSYNSKKKEYTIVWGDLNLESEIYFELELKYNLQEEFWIKV